MVVAACCLRVSWNLKEKGYPLTTVHIPKYELGQESMRLLCERMEKGIGEPRKIVLKTKLMIRKSS